MSGTGKPSAEHDKFTAPPVNCSVLLGTTTKCGATK